MSIIAEITNLEQRVQELLAKAGTYKSVDDFVKIYTEAILAELGKISGDQLNTAELLPLVEKALEASADFINVNLANEIQSGVGSVLDETTAFYAARNLELPNLSDAVTNSRAATEIRDLFTTNMASMREELRDGTIDVLQDELAQGFLIRDDLEELIFQYADGKAHYARTNARMVVSTFNRIGREQIRESAELKHGYYYGDARVNTRPFCLHLIGKVFTIQQIEQMDNGQLSPVSIYAGGWNCIHSWLWVDPEWDNQLKEKISTEPISTVDDEYLTIKVPGE
jgi:hypothetical protein